MTSRPPRGKVSAEEKKAKDKVRKSGTSAEGKIIQLGETSKVFSAVVYFNPTHERLEGAVYIPEGQYMPDVNGFLVELLKDSCDEGPGHGPRRARTDRQLRQPSRVIVRGEGDVRTGSNGVGAAVEAPAHADTVVSQAHDNSIGINGAGLAGEAAIGHVGTPYAARHGGRRTEDWSQVDRRMADDSALRNAGVCATKQEMPDGAVGDRRAAASAGMFGIGAYGVPETVGAGCKMENDRSGDVSEWETVDAQDTRAPAAPAARETRAGLSRTQAAKVQWFLRQVSLHMQLASRQERLPPYRIAHQDRWRASSQRNRRR